MQRSGDGAAVCAGRTIQSCRRRSEVLQNGAAAQQCPRRRGGEPGLELALHRLRDRVPVDSGKAVQHHFLNVHDHAHTQSPVSLGLSGRRSLAHSISAACLMWPMQTASPASAAR